MLNEIRVLIDNDDRDDAFELLEAYLEDYPADVQAQVLKIELCLDLGRDFAYVGETLPVLEQTSPELPEVRRLRERVDEKVRDRLKRGRKEVKGRHWDDARDCFDAALALSSNDPTVALSAGIALYQRYQEELDAPHDNTINQVLGLLSLRSADRSRAPDTATMQAIERYLQLALQNSPPEHRVHTEAVRFLAQHWLTQERIDDTLALLEENLPHISEADAITADVAQQVVARALRRVTAVLRANRSEVANDMLTTCAELLPNLPALRLLQAEYLAQIEQHDSALAIYKGLLEQDVLASQPVSLEAARTAWERVRDIHLTCERCGKAVSVGDSACAYCDAPVGQTDLLIDNCCEEGAPQAAIAHLGMAAVLARQGCVADAFEHIEAAIVLLPVGHAAARKAQELRRELTAIEDKAPPTNPARDVLASWQTQGLTPSILAEIARISDQSPDAWLEQPFQKRRALTRALLAEGHLQAARAMLDVAFSDNPARKTIVALRSRLARAIEKRETAVLARANREMTAGRYQQVTALTDDILALIPDSTAARLLRAEAHLAAGDDLAALSDFQMLIQTAGEPDIQRLARIGAARALENRFDFTAAHAVLEGLDDEQTQTIRARLTRREKGEPFIRVQQTTDIVAHDTLSRQSTTPYYHGFFAVALRAVGKPWGSTAEEWERRIRVAGFEFVQALGGLRNTVGTPVFALRIISTPDTEIAERGRLTIALLARVSAPDEDACRALAQNLWEVMRSLLPLEHVHVYSFEPVADADELDRLLTPFDVASAAEIVRRENSGTQAGERYAVFPFTSGTVDMHNLCWALLRQQAPTMVSIHLLPTDLLPWERTTLDRVMLSQRTASLAAAHADAAGVALQDSVPQWWQETKSVSGAVATRRLVDALAPQAFVMQVNVASGSQSNLLLPEVVASTLFGPAGVSGGTPYGGYEVVRAAGQHEVDTMQRNLAMVDVEQWVYSAAPEGLGRLRHMVGEHEAAITFRLPIPRQDGVPGMAVIEAKPIAPPPGLPVRGTVLGQSVIRVHGRPLRLAQAVDDRRRHTYVVGKTGTGKSTLLENMVLQDIEAGRGVCVVDPHGDLVESILRRIPAHRIHDVILFDPADEARPIGLNLLSARTESDRHRIVNEFIGLLVRMYDPGTIGIVGPRFQHNVRNAMLTAMAIEGGTLIEAVRVMTDSAFVRKVLPLVTDPLVRNYWEKQIANTSDFHKSEILDYIVSKFSRFVGDSRVRNIIGQRETTLDLRQVMDRQQILLVNLSKGKIGPESAQFLGLLLVQSLLITALSRSDLPPDRRPDFFLYVDEFQNFATELFGVMLSEGRKYGIAATVANQYLTQLDPGIREALFGNVGTLISFRLGTQDAAALAPEMYPIFSIDDLLNLPKFTACVKLLVNGTAARPFSMETLPVTRPPDASRAAAVREHSRMTYGRDARAVTADILARFDA